MSAKTRAERVNYQRRERPLGLSADLMLDKSQVQALRNRWLEHSKELQGGTPILTEGLKVRRATTMAVDSMIDAAKRASSGSDIDFMQSFNAADWATAFCKRFPNAPDADTMIAWFASAIMRGYDEGVKRRPMSLQQLQQSGRIV